MFGKKQVNELQQREAENLSDPCQLQVMVLCNTLLTKGKISRSEFKFVEYWIDSASSLSTTSYPKPRSSMSSL
jgi:hypothetical protein